MEQIHLCRFENRKIKVGTKPREQREIPLKNFINTFKEKNLYILDLDAINSDKPNLCSYPKLSKKFELWVDAGPTNIGDVVDILLTGVKNIIIRENLWDKKNTLSEIREITENKVFININLQNIDNIEDKISFSEADGIIIFDDKTTKKLSFKKKSILKDICKKYSVYIYEKSTTKNPYLEKIDIDGIIKNID